MSKRAECIAKGTYAEDGTLMVEGHPYAAVCCVYDRETDRYYSVLKCDNCGKVSAAFGDGLPADAAEMYGEVIKVAG